MSDAALKRYGDVIVELEDALRDSRDARDEIARVALGVVSWVEQLHPDTLTTGQKLSLAQLKDVARGDENDG